MAEFNASATRVDPYKNFRFRVKIDGQYVAALSKCSGLKKSTEVIDWRDAGADGRALGHAGTVVRKLTGRTSFQPITLEQGVTHDTTFQTWANQVNNGGDATTGLGNYEPDLSKYRKDIFLEVLREDGQKVLGYTIKNAWVSEYQAYPDSDAGAHAVSVTTIKIENEGWFQDFSSDPGGSL